MAGRPGALGEPAIHPAHAAQPEPGSAHAESAQTHFGRPAAVQDGNARATGVDFAIGCDRPGAGRARFVQVCESHDRVVDNRDNVDQVPGRAHRQAEFSRVSQPVDDCVDLHRLQFPGDNQLLAGAHAWRNRAVRHRSQPGRPVCHRDRSCDAVRIRLLDISRLISEAWPGPTFRGARGLAVAQAPRGGGSPSRHGYERHFGRAIGCDHKPGNKPGLHFAIYPARGTSDERPPGQPVGFFVHDSLD